MSVSGRRDLFVLGTVVLVALALRLVDLPARGRWDDDQGAHLLAVRAWVVDGTVPLVGPTSSLGEAHHGALYYWLLAPGAALTGSDPLAALVTLVGIGVVAVIAAWALGRVLAGPVGGAIAGLLAAFSPAWIEASTFVWNPNLVPAGAAVAAAGAWAAWARREPRGWAVAALGLVVAVQGHLLAAIVVPAYLALLVADARRPRDVDEQGRFRRWVAAAAAVVAVAYLPLAVHELRSGFSETRAIVGFLAGGGEGSTSASVAETVAVTLLRSLSWPLTGLLTSSPLAGVSAAFLVLVAGAWRFLAGASLERAFVVWSAGTTAWSVAALAIVAPSLATIVPELPTDHYHAFLDPLVIAILSIAGAAIWRHERWPVAARRATAVLAVGAIVALGIPAWPPVPAPDGGWAGADRAAARVASAISGPVELISLPAFKTGDGLRFPLVRRAVRVVEGTQAALVLTCDPAFEDVIGARCGGPAEDAWMDGRPGAGSYRLVDRFESGPRRTISVYVRANG